MRSRGPDPAVLLRLRATENFRRQVRELQRLWPMLMVQVTGTKLVVLGEVQPTPLSDTYRVRIVYVFAEPPEAYVDDPVLKPRYDGAPIPHVYPGPRPCLYLPGSGEWTGKEMIAATIIPWLLLWLTYYELWHATGEWQGGGVHPGDAADETNPPGTHGALLEQTSNHPPAHPD